MKKLKALIIFLFIANIALPSYGYILEMATPLDSTIVSANFGQFRDTNGYKIHDGIDYPNTEGTPVYAIVAGTAKAGNGGGWGKYVIITSPDSSFQTRYAHLSEIPSGWELGISYSVNAGDIIGKVGHTGVGTGDHLHFGIGPSVSGDNELNPITHGLKQPAYGDAVFKRISGKELSSSTEEYILFMDANDGAKRLVNNGITNRTLKIICEAYQDTGRFSTNPYKVKFTITKVGDSSYKQTKEIVFNDLTFEVENYYRTDSPYNSYFLNDNGVNKGDYKNFFFMEWTPVTIGEYEVEVKTYVAYWNGNSFIYPRNSDDEQGRTNTKKRKIEITDTLIGLIDSAGMYTWQPTDAEISASGVVRAAGVEWPKPRYVTDLSNTIFTSNITDVSPDFQKYTEFTVAAARATDWTIRIKDMSDVERYKIEKKGVADAVIKWDGTGVSDGKYKYEVEAKDPLTGVKATKQGISYITIDNTKPELLANWTSGFPTKTSIVSTNDSTSIQFQPQEDLYSVGVNIVDATNRDNKIITGLGWSPSLKKNEVFTVSWDGAGHYPDGTYRFEVVMTDLAGNINKVYSKPIVVNVSETYIPSPDIVNEIPIPYFPYRGLAVDDDGNCYIPSLSSEKIIKYDKHGNLVKEYPLTTPLFYAEGLFYRNGRLLIVDGKSHDLHWLPRLIAGRTAENSINVDNNFSLGQMDGVLCGREVIARKTKYKHYHEDGFLFVKWVVDNYEGEIVEYNSTESFDQPKDIAIDSNGNIYVVDSGKHRVLRYDRNGNPSYFESTRRDWDAPYRGGGGLYIGRLEDYQRGSEWTNALNVDAIERLLWQTGDDYETELIFLQKPGSGNGQFYIPTSIAIDNSDNIYVADAGNNRIQKFAPDGSFVAKFGSEGTGPGQFKSPQGICVDEDNHIWVVDTGNKRIQEFKNDGTFAKSWGNAEMLSKPLKLVVKKMGRNKTVYVADGDKNEVQIFGGSPPTDFRLTKTGNQLIPGLTFTISWTTSEADWYGLKKYEVYGRIVEEGMDENDEKLWVYLKKDILPSANSAEISLLYDGIYDIKVKAVDNNGNWRDSDGGSSSGDSRDPSRILRAQIDATPPLFFSLTYPGYGRSLDAKDVRIAWNATQDKNLDYYEVMVGTDPEDMHGTEIFSATIPASATREVWVRDLERGTYYIYLAAYDKAGHYRRIDGKTDMLEFDVERENKWAAAWPSFEIDPIPPQIFTISNIYNGQYFNSRDVGIAWSVAPDRDLDHYELYIGTDRNNIMGTAVYAATFEAPASREALANLPGGTYWIYMRAYDKLGDFRGLDGKTNASKHDLDLDDNLVSFEIDHEPPVVAYNPSNFSPPVTERYFSPNGDGKKDDTTINYSIGDDSYWKVNYLHQNEVSIEVKGEIVKDGQVARSWTNRSPPGWQQVIWDGTDNRGNRVEDGVYAIRITTTDKALNTATNESQWVTVDTAPPEIGNVASSGIFSPNADGEFDIDNLSFNLSDNLSPDITSTVEVIDNESRLITRSMEPRRLAAGSMALEWDGLTLNSWVAPDATYKYRVSAEDLAGNSTINDSTIITVDTTPPQIVNLTGNISKQRFTETSGSLDLKFKIQDASGRANVQAIILDARGSIIQNYPLTAEADHQYQLSWNGRDSFGFFVPDNSYVYYCLSAVDCVGNRKYLENDQLIRVETPYSGVYGNVIYSPDGELKIIIPAGAVTSEAELSIEMRDTTVRSYQVQGNDNITLTYEFLPEGLRFNKPCTLMFHYNPGALNFPGQPVLPYQYSADGWEQLAGNIRNNVFTSNIAKTGAFVVGADLTPPLPPAVNQPHSPTTSDLITVSGTAEHNSTVNLNVNGILYAKVVHSPDWSIPNVDLSEGENNIVASARDEAGNISRPSETVSVFKDTIPPILTVSNDETLYISPNGDGAQETAHIMASALDAGSAACEVWLSINNPAGREIFLERYENSLDINWGDPTLSEGNHSYSIHAIDALDNFSQRSGTIVVDKTAPYDLLELLPQNYYLSGNLEIWGSVEDNNFLSWVIDYGAGSAPSSYTEIARGYSAQSYRLLASFDTHLLPTGIYTFRLTAYDRAGNVKSITKSKHIINSPINTYIFSPAAEEYVRDVVNVQGSISVPPPDFSHYYLEYGSGISPLTWSIILESHTLPTTSDLGSWNTRGLSDGVYTIRLRAVNLGGENFVFDVPVTIDNTSPISSITYPTSVEVLGGIINIIGTATDANFAQYKVEYGEGINPLSWTELKTSLNPVSAGTLASWVTGTLNGTYTIRLTTTDKAGNSTSTQVYFTVDNYINASLDSPSTGMVLGDTIHIRGTASDINFSEYRLEYGAGSNPIVFTRIGEVHTGQVSAGELGSWDTRMVSDGTYTIRLVVVDQAGNEVKKTATIIVDNTYPTVSISNPTAGSYLAKVVNIAGTAYDDNIQSHLLEYQDNSNPGTWHYIYASPEAGNIQGDAIYDWDATSLNDSHTIRVSVTDKTGKTSSAEVSVILDNIEPTINITSPTRESVNTGSLNINGEISDINLQTYTIKYGAGIEPTQFWSLTSGTSSQTGSLYTWLTSNVKDGYYTLKYEAEDKAGNQSVYEFPVIIDNAPAIAEIQAPTANQIVRGVIDIKGIACDADFTTYNFKRYEILYGQGSSPVSWTTIESLVVPKINETLTSWNTVGLADGTYTLKLKAQDISGITEKTRTIIIDNALPILSITLPNDGATVSGNVNITGSITDANLEEYRIYHRGAGDWVQIASSLSATWDSRLVGDGAYTLKLWAKDKAGNEHEITRNITVNNTLDVNNVSIPASTFSPNGDGIEDRISLKYNLTENSNVTVKVYKKPSAYAYNWEAFASGTRYPRQDFSYTLSASGTDHQRQYFNYTLSASGTRYPPREFGWRVDASGTENYYIYKDGTIISPGSITQFTADHNHSCPYSLTAVTIFAGIIIQGYAEVKNVTDNVIVDSISGSGSKTGSFNAISGKTYSVYVNSNSGQNASVSFQSQNPASSVHLTSDSSLPPPTITRTGTITGDQDYSVTLSPEHPDGTISGHSISYTQTSGSGVSSSRDGSGWSGNTCSGVINASYIYSGDPWSTSGNGNDPVCTSGPGAPLNYSEPIGAVVGVDEYVPSPTFTLSGPTDPDVYLRFSDTGTSTTYDRTASVIGSTTSTAPWNPDPVPAPGSCTPGPGIPTNYSRSISSLITVLTTVSGPTFTLSGLDNSNVSLRFSDTGTQTTTNPNISIIGTTSYTQPWTTANHIGGVVGSGGWIRWGPNNLPFYYNEAPEAKNVRTITGYIPPSDVVINSWTVNTTNSYTTIYGANANSDFNVRLADGMLVKTLQYDTLTSAGEHTIEWDGTDNSGTIVANDDYIFVIYAGGNTVKKGINGEYPVKVQKSSEITALSASESCFSPNGDGVKDSIDISYDLTKNASSVSIQIKDKYDAMVRNLTGPTEAGHHSVLWNGRDDAGTVVADGAYTAKIMVTHTSGAVREKSVSIIVDNNNPSASDEEPKAIVSSAAFEEDPIYSPDKTKIAFAKEISGKKQICIMDLTDSQVTQLTSQGENKEPGWSPDGTKIGFISDRSGALDLWTMNADGLNAKQIIANSELDGGPAWSPDGTKLAYATNRQGQLMLSKWNIWAMDSDGANPTQITKDETTFRDDSPTWSPDGKKLAYASDQDENYDIWMVNADGGSKAKILASSEAETKPAWSPDGLKIVYKNERGIGLYDLKGRSKIQLITAEGATNPSWARDGTEIVYNDSAGNIYSKSTYRGALTGVITYPILSQTISGLVEIKGTALDTNLEGYKVEYSPNTTPYVWTEIGTSNIPKKDSILAVWNTAPLIDGQYILRLTAWDKAGNSLINSLLINSDNDNWKLTIASLVQITTSEAWDIEPAWSPDGSRFAFSSNRSGNYDIWLMNPAEGGTGLQNITNNSVYDGKPAWSPNGLRIAFVSDRSGNKDIWTMNADGSDLRQLTNLTIIDTDPCWSPDGTQIAFASDRSDNFDIWAVNSDGSGTPRKITSSEAYEGEPSWSSQGLAFTSDRSGDKEIWMLNPAFGGTGEAFQLTNNSAEDKEPSWSPFAMPLSDGSRRPLITFTSTRQDNSDIYLMDTDGIDQSKSLTDYTNTDCNPAWSPDGTRVAYASFKDGQYDIWVMNFAINTSILSIPAIQQTATMEIISPKDGKNIGNLRPTFEWYGLRGQTSYRVAARKDIETRTFPKNITQTEASPEAGARPAIAYAIHEFDEGLGRGVWNWKVQALNSDNSVLAETAEETFEIDPPFSLSGITNYPNPFNPNKERTKLRYKLSKDADEVMIRIYDLTGALVNELTGTSYGEGANIWSKYNDIEWDGRNGRGDMVLNGIYPFEVVAKLNGASVSGRGKIAVLK